MRKGCRQEKMNREQSLNRPLFESYKSHLSITTLRVCISFPSDSTLTKYIPVGSAEVFHVA
jgi:hypothetical protein